MTLKYSDELLTERQEKNADKIIKILMNGFGLNSPPEHNVKGLLYYDQVQELENDKMGRTPKEIKQINKKIKNLELNYGDKIKVTFTFNDHLRKLVFMNQIKMTRRSYVMQHMWTGILDFPIPDAFIFGRVAKRQRHGGGSYVFAPLDLYLFSAVINIDDLVEKVSLVAPDVVDANQFIDLLDKIRFSRECFDAMKLMLERTRSKDLTGNSVVDNFNLNKPLLKAVGKIEHFGHLDTGIVKYQSEVDVSIICFPSGGRTFLQVVTFTWGNKKTCAAIKTLVDTLVSEYL